MASGAGGGEGRRRRRWQRRLSGAACLPRPGCFTVSAAGEDEGTSASGAGEAESKPKPTHLVVTVHGIVGSAENWRFAAKHFIKKHPEDVVVHCSGCNVATRTLDGVDVMGKRLAEEVISVVECRPELRKISFVAHSLGGLVARYAIALLYESNTQKNSHEECEKHVVDSSKRHTVEGTIAGLEPINFITFATPHLGTRSHKQIPLLRGSNKLEKMAFRLSWIAGRSGKHLFLKDIEDEKPPLLLQMVTDYGDLRFMSALGSFKRRVLYSNVCGDFIVGWRTSSIRRQHELPKHQCFRNDGRYPHIVYVEDPKAQDVEFLDALIYEAKTTSEMEEVMIKGLNRLPWERVDVSFKKSKQKIFAHSTIQVKSYLLNSDGADVIFHMIDHFLY